MVNTEGGSDSMCACASLVPVAIGSEKNRTLSSGQYRNLEDVCLGKID